MAKSNADDNNNTNNSNISCLHGAMTRHYFPRNTTTLSTSSLSNNRVEPVVDHLTEALEKVIKEPLGAIGLNVNEGGIGGGGGGAKTGRAGKAGKKEREMAENGGSGGGNERVKSPKQSKKKTATDKPKNVLPLCHPETHVWRDGELQVF